MLELVTDQTFQLNRTNKYKLSIQVCLDGFSFSVVSTAENRLLALKSIPVTISSEKFLSRRFDEWVKSEKIVENSFAEVEINYFTRQFTLVPEEFFQFEKQNEMANLLFENKNSNQLFHNHIGNLKADLIAAIPADLILKFDSIFEKYSLFHSAVGLLQKSTEQFGKGVACMLNFYRSSFFTALLKNGRLLLANSYNYQHPNDVLYYTMTILEQHQLQANNCRLVLSGNISEDDEKDKMLRRYFDKTQYFSPDIKYDTEKFSTPLHPFTPLI